MNSIRTQLTRRLLVSLAWLLGLGLLAIYVTVWITLVDSYDTALRARAISVSSLTEVEGGKVGFDFSDDFLRGYKADRPRNYFELWDATGTLLKRSPSLGPNDLIDRGGGTADRPNFWNTTLPNGRPGRATAFVFKPEHVDAVAVPETASQVRLVVATDREDFNETLWGLLAAVLGCGVLLLGAVFLLVPRVLRRGLAALDDLGAQAARIDATKLQTRFSVSDLPLELRPIAGRLNDLLARLEQSFERERRFSADLAHELRTPLAELRSAAECALKWPESRDAAVDRDTLAIARQMEAMVGHMLALARGEQGQLAVRLEPIALEKLVPEIWRGFAPRAVERGLKVRLSIDPAMVNADPAMLRSILTNLCDNAVDYTSAGGEVMIEVKNSHARGVVRLSNTTDQLEATDVARLFDRFWRKEAARTDGRHVGLGLPLARSLAVAMDWQLSATLLAGDRIVFTLQPNKTSAVPERDPNELSAPALY